MKNKLKLELVNFEQAKALMELGFPQLNADYSYSASGDELVHFVDSEDYVISAPSLELVAKWLRKEKRIYVSHLFINTFGGYGYYNVLISCHSSSIIKEGELIDKFYRVNDSYEAALSVGIDEAIEILERI